MPNSLCRISGALDRTALARRLVTLAFGLILFAPVAEAGSYVDPATGYRISYDEDVSPVVLELMAKKITAGKPIFKRSHIYRTRNVGPEATLVRTATQHWLVQTDLNTVEPMQDDVLLVWKDLIIYKNSRFLGTLDRRTMKRLHEQKLLPRGEGEARWTVTDDGSSVGTEMHWVPHGANFAVACATYLVQLGFNDGFEHTPEGSYHYTVSADGSISETAPWSTKLKAIIGILMK